MSCALRGCVEDYSGMYDLLGSRSLNSSPSTTFPASCNRRVWKCASPALKRKSGQARAGRKTKQTSSPVHAHAVAANTTNDSTARNQQHQTEVIETDMVVIGSGIGGGKHSRHDPELLQQLCFCPLHFPGRCVEHSWMLYRFMLRSTTGPVWLSGHSL